jgi:hypothetical protein
LDANYLQPEMLLRIRASPFRRAVRLLELRFWVAQSLQRCVKSIRLENAVWRAKRYIEFFGNFSSAVRPQALKRVSELKAFSAALKALLHPKAAAPAKSKSSSASCERLLHPKSEFSAATKPTTHGPTAPRFAIPLPRRIQSPFTL